MKSSTTWEGFKNEFNEIFKNEEWKRRGFYSKKELSFFERWINFKIDQTKKNIEIFQEGISEGNSTRGTDPSYKEVSDLGGPIWIGQAIDLIQKQRKFLLALERSLIRVKQNEYGKCLRSGKIIPPERLFMVPHTTILINYKK